MDQLNHIRDDQLEKLESEFGLPLHLYFLDRIARNAEDFKDVAARMYPATEICYAVKSNPCRGAIKAAKINGLGVDVVSEYELRAALQERIQPEKIVCNGNAKSDIYLVGN